MTFFLMKLSGAEPFYLSRGYSEVDFPNYEHIFWNADTLPTLHKAFYSVLNARDIVYRKLLQKIGNVQI